MTGRFDQPPEPEVMWRSPWGDGAAPDNCELCGARADHYTAFPMVRVCGSCARLPLTKIADALLDRGIDPMSRMPPLPE